MDTKTGHHDLGRSNQRHVECNDDFCTFVANALRKEPETFISLVSGRTTIE